MSTAVTTLPDWQLRCQGSSLPADIVNNISSIHLRTQADHASQLEIQVIDPPADSIFPSIGHKLSLCIDGNELFTGPVTATRWQRLADGVACWSLRAHDPWFVLGDRQQQRLFTDSSARAVLADLFGAVSIPITMSGNGPHFARLSQTRQADADLAREVLHRAGLHAVIDDGSLQVFDLHQGRGGATITLHAYHDCLELDCDNSAWQRCRRLDTTACDAVGTRVLKGQVQAGAPAGSEADGLGSGGTHQIVNCSLSDGSLADSLAKGHQARCDANEHVVSGVCHGRSDMRVGSQCHLHGLGPEREVVLTEVEHRLDRQQGYTTRFSSHAPEAPALRRGLAASFGVVTAVKDPDGRGRVQVRFPAFDDLVVEWLPVVIPAAGNGKGITALPDVDDTVLVLLFDDDPTQGIVIGGIYTASALPDTGADSGAIAQFTMLTKGGQSLRLDDSGDSARLDNADGSYIELAPGGSTLHSATSLTIEAPGQTITISAAKVDFKKG